MRAEFVHRFAKARKTLAAFGVMALASGLGLGLAWNAGLFGGAAAEAAQQELLREAAARQAEHLAFTDVYLRHETREVRVGSGETLAGLLVRAGASPAAAGAAVNSLVSVYDPRRMRPGQQITLSFLRDGDRAEAHRACVPLRSWRVGAGQSHRNRRVRRARSVDAGDV
ncbi:MAG: hypothetical protein NVV62_13995 [Terricaulis sp.]|nr:hypothetical protein [Terricaulis sp.]